MQHIDLGIKYDPGIGIFGMDFYVVMGRPGMRVARRKYKHGRIGAQHKVKKEDSVSWFKQRFDGIVGRVSRNEDHILAMSGRSAWLNECSASDPRHTVNNYYDDNQLVDAPGSQQSDWRASSKRDLHLFPSLRPLRFCTPGVPLAPLNPDWHVYPFPPPYYDMSIILPPDTSLFHVANPPILDPGRSGLSGGFFGKGRVGHPESEASPTLGSLEAMRSFPLPSSQESRQGGDGRETDERKGGPRLSPYRSFTFIACSKDICGYENR